MYTLAVWLALFNDTCSDLNTSDTSFCFLFVCFQLLDHLIRNMDAGYVVVHELSHSSRFRNDDTNLYRFSELFCLFHKFDEFLRLKYSLCLEVVCTCSNLSFHLCKLSVNGIAAWRYNGTLGEFRWLTNQLVGEPPKFSKGAVVSPCSDSVDAQLAKMERKVAAGADYFQTQAVFEPEKFIKFMEKAKQFGKPVQVGIIIPKSAGMAKFMNNNVAGIHVPDEMIEELKADKEKTKAGITGVEIAARIIKECKPYCQGVHIMALGWESKIPALLEQAEI